MRKQASSRSKALLSGLFLGLALLGSSVLHAQGPRPATAAGSATQRGNVESGTGNPDIRRGQTAGDVDGDGYGDASTARQADLKKLADELVNVHQPPADTNSQGESAVATKVDAGNALNAGSMSRRAGDPIPGIDITVNQGTGTAADQSKDDGDPTTQSVPALDPNPYL